MINGSARNYALLSIAAAVITIGMKLAAYFITQSVGLLSDALESVVNLIAAVVAFWALTVAARPPDEEHVYGHAKVEFFASGVEGALILVAAVSIAVTSVDRLFNPHPLEQVGIGLAISTLSAAVNGGVALVLFRAGKALRSAALNADAHHLLTDVWTTLGVIVGVALASWTGWLILDPIIALVVAANIVWTGAQLLRSTGLGLMDTALPEEDKRAIGEILASYEPMGIRFHALRTRGAGARRFMSVHILVPGGWTVLRGHNLCEEIEMEIRGRLPGLTVFTHLEPIEDPAAWEDQGLDRVTHRPQ